MITGSFDPVTTGHLDLIKRTARIFGKVYVAVLINPDKRYVFTTDERLGLLRLALNGIANAEAVASSGSAVDLAKQYRADCFVRGLRDGEYGYERDMAAFNYQDGGGIDTVFLPATESAAKTSSTMVKNLLAEGQSVEAYIPSDAYKDFLKLCQGKIIR